MQPDYAPDLNNYNYLLIIDLEATCSNDGAISRREMEIIEIGAVLAPYGWPA